MKRLFLCFMALVMILSLIGCNNTSDDGADQNGKDQNAQVNADSNDGAQDSETSQPNTSDGSGEENGGTNDELPPEEPTAAILNGKELSEYSVIYPNTNGGYAKKAAEYIRDTVLELTGITLEVSNDRAEESECEIIVGETSRAISAKLEEPTYGMEFALMADGTKIALEGDYFIIAAAAYYFVDTYITGEFFDSQVAETPTVAEPITEKAENYILLIGDGMGLYQTQLYSYMSPQRGMNFHDNEDTFYGYLFPYMGFARTNSLSGTTDSAASGTALATGYKTVNGYIGKDGYLNDIMSLTELAASLGKATAVMSTESVTGATPAAFSAHANSRNDSDEILSDQAKLAEKYGTLIYTVGDYYSKREIDNTTKTKITQALNQLDKDEDGFFLMYEEAYIDKHCHNNDINKTFLALMRFNQAIGVFMEYAFYNPDTVVLITADHETGSLLPNGSGSLSYGSGGHSSHNVPVFAYGYGMEVFDANVIENVQIPMTFAHMWGVDDIFGDPNSKFAPLR